MKTIISIFRRPTLEGVIMLPLLIVFNIATIVAAIIPGKIGFAIWDLYDSIVIAISDFINDSIENGPCLWDIKFFE